MESKHVWRQKCVQNEGYGLFQATRNCLPSVVISAEHRGHLAFDLLKWESCASPRRLAVDAPCVSESDPERAALDNGSLRNGRNPNLAQDPDPARLQQLPCCRLSLPGDI